MPALCIRNPHRKSPIGSVAGVRYEYRFLEGDATALHAASAVRIKMCGEFTPGTPEPTKIDTYFE
jgi:hypothetical protein